MTCNLNMTFELESWNDSADTKSMYITETINRWAHVKKYTNENEELLMNTQKTRTSAMFHN